MTTRERALGALTGLAIGDALGMPTQMMSREAIAARFGRLTGFEPAAADHPLAAGMAAGRVTDDTEQALLVARALIAGRGHIDPLVLATLLGRWEDDMRAGGSLDLLGPSTRSAIAALRTGTPVGEAGRYGATNGAAMRIAPVGIALPADDLAFLVSRVRDVSSVTHNTGIAIAGAAAVAAAISAAIDGADLATATRVGVDAARIGARQGYWVAGADVGERITWAVGLVDRSGEAAGLDLIYRLVGTSLATQESVPAAFAVLSLYPDDPWPACLAAAGLGGDSDTVAAMVGAVAGACHGVGAFPADAVETVNAVNGLDLEPLVAKLLTLRSAARR